jgi:hypothetical protein
MRRRVGHNPGQALLFLLVSRDRTHREGEGRLLLMARPFKSQETALAFAARPVESSGSVDEGPVAARFGACACAIRTKAGHLSRRSGLADPVAMLVTNPPIARVPSDAEKNTFATREGGQTESPLRPAAGVGSSQAQRHIAHFYRQFFAPQVHWCCSD